MMLTASVAAAIRSDSFSKSVTHITPRKGVNRHSPVVGFIIAHRFVMGKHKTEQICSDPKKLDSSSLTFWGQVIRLLSFYVLILLATFTPVFVGGTNLFSPAVLVHLFRTVCVSNPPHSLCDASDWSP